MSGRKRIILLIVIMIAVSLIVVGITIYFLYKTSFEEQRARLVETTQSQARLIEAVIRFNIVHQEKWHPQEGDPVDATLSEIIDAHSHYKGFGKTGEFTLARREGDYIIFLLRHRHGGVSQEKPIRFDSELAEPMRRALSGKSGTMIGLDYRGETVLAAYEPVKILNFGIVAKIDIAEIRRPFVSSTLLFGSFIVLVIMAGVSAIFWISNPVVRTLKERTSELVKMNDQMMQEIEERKQAEETIRNSEERFRTLVENSLTGISIIQDNRIVYQNPEQKKLLGPLPRPIKLTDLSSIHPEDVEKVKEFYRNMASGNIQTQDIDFRFYPPGNMGGRHDMRWVYCRTSLIEYRGEKAIMVILMDMTRAKELEHLVKIQDKMSSLGRVTAGIAHEIRNPLSGINIYLNTLEKIYNKAESLNKVKAIIEHLQSASAKIESVIRRVMDFSKPSEPKLILTTINEPIEEALKLSSVTLRKRGIEFEKTLLEDLPPCHLDPHMIEQVILNLITNAAEAMKNIDGEKTIALSSSMKNNRIVVKVSDSGPGVSPNRREKIFDPFYSTKNGSTGIGLSLSHRVITDHGGSLSVSQSKLGGAEFVIEIPIKNQET